MTKNEPTTDTQKKISDTFDAMKDLLLYKNKMYGDSALKPRKGWYKGDAQNSILVRLMDKQARIDNNPSPVPRVNDVCDIIGYCTLLLISMGVTPEDIAKFKEKDMELLEEKAFERQRLNAQKKKKKKDNDKVQELLDKQIEATYRVVEELDKAKLIIKKLSWDIRNRSYNPVKDLDEAEAFLKEAERYE